MYGIKIIFYNYLEKYAEIIKIFYLLIIIYQIRGYDKYNKELNLSNREIKKEKNYKNYEVIKNNSKTNTENNESILLDGKENKNFDISKNDLTYNKELNKEKDKLMEEKKFESFDIIKNNAMKDPNLEIIFKEINIIKHIFINNIEEYKLGKNIIHITESLNNNDAYKYIHYVSMYSLLSNCYKNKTFVIYHLLCSHDFDESSISIFKTLFKHFGHNLEIIFYNMGNHFLNRKNNRCSQSTYYRLLAPLMIDSDRLIHLDGDTLIYSDLTEMYNLDFNDNYILGTYDVFSFGIDYLGIKSKVYINAGVILFNSEKIREHNKTFEFLKLTNSNTKLDDNDQTTLNLLLYPKIGRLPCKYGILNFEDKTDLESYLKQIRTPVPMEELEEAFKNPAILHIVLCFPKPWFPRSVYTKTNTACTKRQNCSCDKYFKLWHSVANKTDYYEEIKSFTGV